MSTDSDRDPVTDALLRKALQPTPRTGADACVDAETLAAWAEGNLQTDRAADLEAHLASCSHCQAVLGAFTMSDESTAPAASPAAVIPFTPKSPIRWIVPLAASVAAALVLWTAVRNRDAAATPETTMAKIETPHGSVTPSTPTSMAGELASKAAPAAVPVPARAERRETTAKSNNARARTIDAPKISASPAPTPAQTADSVAPLPAVRPTPAPVAAPPPPAAPPPVAVGQTANREVTMLRTDTEPIRADSLTAALSKVVAEFAPPATPTIGLGRSFAGGGRGGGGGGGARAAAMPADGVAPRVRWRVLASGQVMKSTNGGEWAVVPITPTVFILNGHAPSPTVCWLVGRTGIVELSTDGTKFTRVNFPDLSDLRSVTATDAREAAVTTTDGRVFTTENGGETWQLK